MNWRGLNFSPGLSSIGQSMAKGYQDYQELLNKDQPRAVPQEWAEAILNPAETMSSIQSTALQGAQSMGQSRPVIGVNKYTGQTKVLLPAGQAAQGGATPNFGTESPSRAPQSELDYGQDSNISYQTNDEYKKNLANRLGLQYKDGQLMAHGKRADEIFGLYEKLLTTAGQSFGYGRNASQPIVQSYGGAPVKAGKPGLSDYEKKRVSDLDDEIKDLRAAKKDMFTQIEQFGKTMVPENPQDPNSPLRRIKRNEIPSYIDQQIQDMKLQQERIYGGSAVGANAPGAVKPSQIQRAAGQGGSVPTTAKPPTAIKKFWNRTKNQTIYKYSDGTEKVVDGIK